MTDLFDSGPVQFGFDLGDRARPVSHEPNRDEVRAELTAILAAAKAAREAIPWDDRTLRYHQTVFPQMANWLPADERDQLCFEFAHELRRLELLRAA